MIMDKLVNKQEEIKVTNFHIENLQNCINERRKRNIEKYQNSLFSLLDFILQNGLKSCSFTRQYKGISIETKIKCSYYQNKFVNEFELTYSFGDNFIKIVVDCNRQLEKTKKSPISIIGIKSFDFIENCDFLDNVSFLVNFFNEDMQDLTNLEDCLVKERLDYEKGCSCLEHFKWLEKDLQECINSLKVLNNKVQDYVKRS